MLPWRAHNNSTGICWRNHRTIQSATESSSQIDSTVSKGPGGKAAWPAGSAEEDALGPIENSQGHPISGSEQHPLMCSTLSSDLKEPGKHFSHFFMQDSAIRISLLKLLTCTV
jgi:hypothetical protein